VLPWCRVSFFIAGPVLFFIVGTNNKKYNQLSQAARAENKPGQARQILR
jgi:hypothetical protein